MSTGTTNSLKKQYDGFLADLPGLIETSWGRLPAAEDQDLDRIAELHDKGWLYAYAVLIHRVRKHDLVKKILEYAVREGFVLEDERDFDIGEDEFAYTLVGRSHRFNETDLLSELESMCCIMLLKEGQKKCIPLLKVQFDESTFDVEVAPYSKIRESIDNL